MWKSTYCGDECFESVVWLNKVTQSTDFTELVNQEPWLSSMKLVVKPDMLFGKRGKSGLVSLNLDLAEVAEFVKKRFGVEVLSSKLDPFVDFQIVLR